MSKEVGSYSAVSIRLAQVLAYLARQYTFKQIEQRLAIPPSTIRDDLARARLATNCADNRELIRWWLDSRLHWAQWVLEGAGIPVDELHHTGRTI